MPATLSDVLDSDLDLDPSQLKQFGGFGGLHGGLAAALMARRMSEHVPGNGRLAALSARFLRPISGPLSLEASVLTTGRLATMAQASAFASTTSPVMTAEAVFSNRTDSRVQHTFSPPIPTDIVPVQEAEVFRVPPEFVPISTRMEIRPATKGLPYTGAPDPVLCAWIRLTEPVPSTTERVLILADALAPSYAAVLTDLTPIPTVGLTVHLSPDNHPDLDWALVRAETTTVGPHGWLTETINVWNEGGTHLATATQLRVVH